VLAIVGLCGCADRRLLEVNVEAIANFGCAEQVRQFKADVIVATASERGNVANVFTGLSYHGHRRVARELEKRFSLMFPYSLPTSTFLCTECVWVE